MLTICTWVYSFIPSIPFSRPMPGRQVNLVVQDHQYDAQKALSRYTQNAPKMLGYMSVLGTPVLSALSNRFKADIGRDGTAGKPLPRHPLVAVQREQPASGEASDRLPGQPRQSRSE
jgi:hypothetical protein